ncbi:MAG TPA: V-type ATPase 116kDa subunit family protein [Streptosporangiaceae bacterium]|nr:V-type ATPase 116kDa subunit family protein [Streptosporangiaceae bacterium]
MPWLEAALPARMIRVALVAPADTMRDMLAAVAGTAAVEIDVADAGEGAEAARRLSHTANAGNTEAALSAKVPDLDELERAGRYDLLAGEAQLQAYAAAAVRESGCAALAGWIPAARRVELARLLAGLGCGVVPLPRPRTSEAPTLLDGSARRRSLSPLVSTYGTVPYADISPAWLAWGSYVLMFGMMFGDAGHGLILIGAAIALRAGWPRPLRRLRAAWPFVGGAGVMAVVFGILYGEFFGPTGLIPAFWLVPLDHPVPLLAAAVAVGAALLAGAYAVGTVNRFREGGWPLAAYAPSGIAGALLFAAACLAAAGWYSRTAAALIAAAIAAIAALGLALAGFLAQAGGGGTGVVQSVVELFDFVVRLGSNVVSFARLAAFGLTHAALGLLVWEATRALWHRGGVMVVAAVAVFAVGNAVAFGLEALVAAIQALRLEYYELFSRVFVEQGRSFRPWHLRVETGVPLPPGSGSLNAKEGG